MTSIVGEEPFNSVNFRSHWEETIINAGKTYFVIFTVRRGWTGGVSLVSVAP